jgi:hypothetical protein
MSPVLAWRLGLIAALLAGAWFVYDLIGDNRELKRAAEAHTRAIESLTQLGSLLNDKMAENQTFDDGVRREATTGVAQNETLRRTSDEVRAIDKPWPAAMRRRVFNDPDPTGGSTAPVGAPAAGSGGEPVPVTR